MTTAPLIESFIAAAWTDPSLSFYSCHYSHLGIQKSALASNLEKKRGDS